MVAADVLLWILMIFAWNNNNKLLATIILIASLVAFYGSLLSVTRGAWLVYIFLILSFVIYTLKRGISNMNYFFSKPILLRIFLAFIVFFLVAQTEQYNQSQISDLIGKTKLACKRLIAYQYIEAQSELSRSRCKEKFETFLTGQLPEQEHIDGTERPLAQLALDGEFSFMLFLDYEVSLFTIDAFKEALPLLKKCHLDTLKGKAA